MPQSVEQKVDFPDPFSPISPWISPFSNSSETLLTAVVMPNRLQRFSDLNMTSLISTLRYLTTLPFRPLFVSVTIVSNTAPVTKSFIVVGTFKATRPLNIRTMINSPITMAGTG